MMQVFFLHEVEVREERAVVHPWSGCVGREAW